MDVLFLIGIAIILGFIGGKVSNRLKFPQVVGYIIMGLLLGPSFFGVFKIDVLDRMAVLTDLALGLIAFIIGSDLRLGVLRRLGKAIITILLVESFGTFFLISLGVYLLTHNLALGLILGALGVATAPAGTTVVLQEYRAKGPLTNTLLAVVGSDDGLAIIIYAFAASIARVLVGSKEAISIQHTLVGPVIEIGGAIILGVVMGIILGYLVRRMHNKQEILAVSLGAILICTGLANHFHLSLILANMVLGMTIANTFLLASRRMYEALRSIALPIYIAFFVLAGAHLRIGLLPKMGLLGLVYIFTRSAAKIGGASLGAYISKADMKIRKYLGFGLFTQAGVAIGLAIIVVREFGIYAELSTLVINTITATTIVLELIGPFGVKYAITRAGEVGRSKA